MANERNLLAKLYYEECEKSSREHFDNILKGSISITPNEKYEKYKKQILDDADFGDVEIEYDGIKVIINHAQIWHDAFFYYKYQFPGIMIESTNSAQSNFRSYYQQTEAFYFTDETKFKSFSKYSYGEKQFSQVLPKIEEAYDNYIKISDNSRTETLKSCLGEIYSYVAFYYYEYNRKGIKAVDSIMQRAKARGITIPYIEYCNCAPDNLLMELEENRVKNNKKSAIDYFLNPKVDTIATKAEIEDALKCFEVSSLKQCSLVIKEDEAKILFKTAIEELKNIPDEIKKALTSDNCEIKVDCYYTPYANVKWNRTTATIYFEERYFLKYLEKWNTSKGKFTWDGKNIDRVEDVGELSKYVKCTDTYSISNRGIDLNDSKEDNKYIMPKTKLQICDDIQIKDEEVRKWLIKDLKYQNCYHNGDISMSFLSDPSYTFQFKDFVFLPLYSVWIRNGNYVVYGFVDGCNISNITILGLCEIKEENEISFYINNKFDPDDFISKKKTLKKLQKHARKLDFLRRLLQTIK